MWSRFNTIASVSCVWLLLAPVLAAPAFAQGTDESTNVDRLWLPSIAFSGGATSQDMGSDILATCANGRPEEQVIFTILGQQTVQTRPACRDPSGVLAPQPVTELEGLLREPASDEELGNSPLVAGQLQLMTPRIEALPFAPRAFLSGEVITFWAPERQIAREGVPTGVQFPPPQTDAEQQNSGRFQASALFGVGSTLRSQVETLGFGANAGLAFPFTFLERRLWLKPSVGWIQYEIEAEGVVEAGLKNDGFGIFMALGGPQLDLRRGPGIRKVSLQARDTQVFNAIGPGLELELEVTRWGPLGISVFAQGQAFSVIGDRKIKLSDTVTCDNQTSPCPSGLINETQAIITNNPPFTIGPEDVISPAGPVPVPGTAVNVLPFAPFGPDTYTANWEFEVEQWGYRGGVGIRFHWLGN